MALFRTQFEILTQVRRVVYTGTNQVITTLIQLNYAHIYLATVVAQNYACIIRTWQMVAWCTPYPSRTGIRCVPAITLAACSPAPLSPTHFWQDIWNLELLKDRQENSEHFSVQRCPYRKQICLCISHDHAQKYLVLVSKLIWYHQELYRVLQNPCNTVLDLRAK